LSTLYRASWVLPISTRARRDGWVLVQDGRVLDVGGGQSPPASRDVHLGDVAVLPGLVNAHTHIELSWMKGRVPPAARMPDWIRALMTLRRQVHIDDPLAMAAAVAEVRRAGTSVVGDVTNTLASSPALAASPVAAHLFFELLGFNEPEPSGKVSRALQTMQATVGGRLHASIVPHAPYSLSRELFAEIARLAARERWVVSVHVGESPEEIEFLRTGTGAWRDLLVDLGVWNGAWSPPRCGPVAYLDSIGLIHERALVVHGTRLTDEDLRLVADRGATLVTCPRSNGWVGVGPPPVSRFYRSGAAVAMGTDSLASSPDLNLFAELHAVRALAPDVPAGKLLDSATRVGAAALGFGDEYGSIAAGRRADLIAVDVPAGTTDVEEYLCSGIAPEAVRWLDLPACCPGPVAIGVCAAIVISSC
jgi:cytosine/adenosine deaminase-related metal-dependent hydrolase